MAKFTIPVAYEMYGTVEVEAETLADACNIVQNDESIGLPENAEYVDGSWQVDYGIVKSYN